jgi:hypothetical protein
VKLIIYLSSHDPNAEVNYDRLRERRRDDAEPTPLNVRTQLVEKKADNLPLTLCQDEVNKFTRISFPTALKVKVEFIAHGVGSPSAIKCMPQGEWIPNNPEGNQYRDIKPIDLKNYFDRYARFSDGSYKFDELTLFVCNGHPFAKALRELMPEIKINCFKEYIKIRFEDGKAYPYDVAGDIGRRIIKPANKEGSPLEDALEFKQSDNSSNSHYPSPTHTFFRGIEEAFYESVNLLPTQLKASLAVPADYLGPIYVRENRFSNTSTLDRLNQHAETLRSVPNPSAVPEEPVNEPEISDAKSSLRRN